jgi:catechol 2,3-dioxygenase-like lactoylglutathione lyase family enzyme
MANSLGTDIIIQVPEPKVAAKFYVDVLGFQVTGEEQMFSLRGDHINLFIEQGPNLGPVLEVTVANVAKARSNLLKNGCELVKDEPEVPRCYVKDPFGLTYNLTT